MRVVHIWFFLLVAAFSYHPDVFSAPAKTKKVRKGKKKSRKKSSKIRKTAISPRASSGIGITLGYEATLGNAVSYHWMPSKSFDVFGGVGYNSTGPKLGGGVVYVIYLSRSLGLRGGAALVGSTGGSGEVSIDAKFTPEGSGAQEDIEASKTYEVGSAGMINLLAGGFWALSKETHLVADATFNSVVFGNEVTLSEDIQFSKDVEATNHTSFERRFDNAAEEKAAAGGLGFNIGIRFLF